MKKMTVLMTITVAMAGLSVGCGRSEEPQAEAMPAAKAAVAPPAEAEQWEPETIPSPEAHDPHDGHDHTGHSH